MIRNFALTFAAVTPRLWLPACVASGLPFEIAYPAIAWVCWLPNLVVAELLVHQTHRPSFESTATGKPASMAPSDHDPSELIGTGRVLPGKQPVRGIDVG